MDELANGDFTSGATTASGRLSFARSSTSPHGTPSSTGHAPRGGQDTGPCPTDRGKLGSKLHLVTDALGTPLAVTISSANVHDSKRLEATVDAVPGVRNGQRGRPKRRPLKLHADNGYDYPRCREALQTRGIMPRIARRGVESSERLERHRWKVERTFAWLLAYRRLAVRRERTAASFLALCQFACSLVVLRMVKNALAA